MKKEFKNFVAGILVGSFIFGSAIPTLAITGTKAINATYNNIKMVIDGKAINTTVEPFLIDGTTYVPIRIVSEALDANVDWDGSTNTINITSKDTVVKNEETQVFMADLKPTENAWKTDSTVNTDTSFPYLKIDVPSRYIYGAPNEQNISYELDGAYNKFTCSLTSTSTFDSVLSIYTDGELAYTSKPVSNKTNIPVELDLTDVKTLAFNVSGKLGVATTNNFMLVEPVLWK